MAETLKGKGIVWGTHGFTGGLATSATDRWGSATTAYVTDCDASIEADSAPIEDDHGETAGIAFYNKRYVWNVTCVPVSTTVALATTAAGNLELEPGTKVTIADTDGTVFDANFVAAYIVTAMRKRKTNKGATVYELTLTQYVGSGVNVAETIV